MFLLYITFVDFLPSGQAHMETVMQSVVSPTATLVTMLMSTAHFLETVPHAHTTLKYIKQSTSASNVGLYAPVELMPSNTPRLLYKTVPQ